MDHICSPIPAAIWLQIADVFWDTNMSAASNRAYHSLGTNLPVSHQGIIKLALVMKTGQKREEVLQSLGTKYTTADIEALGGTVDLVARLLLMLDVGKPARNRMWTGRAFRSWNEGTIQAFTSNIFVTQTSNRHHGIRLDTDFNARNLDAIGGLKVELTNNLFDHLEVVDIAGETTVMIFHHATFLKNQKTALFPDGFVHETLQTLALLFPQNKWYKESKAWYHKHRAGMADADPSVLECGPLTMTSIDDYQFWRDGLVRLKLIFDQAKPRTLRQWWNDRREGSQWYALWVAVGFTIFFGLVQSIEGALQVYKAYHPDSA
ncbi:hypothetical protein QBC35DRAFT_514492 [Podospora australis]|uniref:Uncharacterized protein n=1 Tax=Podospora australis TaxID=1536484 RepID=A0AAN7AIT4_9PEZI|nr:hypothetical protein QBC35DRAFT_514492 [Podospora australis]